MAIRLEAVLSFTDNFSSPMRRMERQVERSERAMNQFNRSTDKAERHHNKLSSTVGKVTRGFGGMKTAILGVAGAFAAVESAKKIFESTVGEAMKMEQSSVIIGAMFNDKALAKQYSDMLEKFAADSPVMDSQTMFSNSKSFISTTKDVAQLEKMWNLTERMAAIDPVQGVEGSVMALKELFSGDAVSMVERFEMPRSIMNEIKSLPLDQQLAKLDEYFNKIGMTTKLIDDMGGTTLGLWGQVREKFALVLRDIGQPSLEVISGFLTKVLEKLEGGDMQRFAQIGGKWIEKILTGLSNAAIDVYDWFTTLTSSPEWDEKTSLASKVIFIIEDIYKRFKKWLDEDGGRKKIEKLTHDLLETVSAGLIASQDILTETASTLGVAVGKALMSAASEELRNWNLGKMNDSWLFKIPGLNLAKEAANDLYNFDPKTGTTKKKNGGLKYVPYDGYQATLHKGETVLPRGAARDYRNGNTGSSSVNLTVNYTGDAPLSSSQMKRFADFLADEIQAAGAAGA